MKLSTRGEYALRALLVLGQDFQEDDSVVRIQEISAKQNIPKRFLEQILNDLKSAGVVESKRGVAGGYRLSRAPEQITLAEIIRHVEGALAPVSCVSERFYEKCSCPDEARCAIRSVMKEVREAVVKIAERVTVADLCERARKLQHEPISPLDFVI
jgi:Rrf2 family protein